MHTFSVIVYARVSKGYDFINEKINEWYSTDGPPVTGCTDLGGFYGSKGVLIIAYGMQRISIQIASSVMRSQMEE
jgi:hypothetical protein